MKLWLRRTSQFIVQVSCRLAGHLRKQMPSMMGKAKAQVPGSHLAGIKG